MVVQVNSVRFAGLKELDQALEALADDETKGAKWKRKAMVEAGRAAMKPVSNAVKSAVPYVTGKWRRGLTLKTIYKYPSKAQQRSTLKIGRVRKGWQHELAVPLTLKRSWREPRYPFMYEVGWDAISIPRTQAFGKPTRPYRVTVPAVEPQLYMHKALGSKKVQVANTFKRHLARNIDILAKTQYKSAATALKRRR